MSVLSSAENFTQFSNALSESKYTAFEGKGLPGSFLQLLYLQPNLAIDTWELTLHISGEAIHRKNVHVNCIAEFLLRRKLNWNEIARLQWEEIPYHASEIFFEKRRRARQENGPILDEKENLTNNIYFIQCNPPDGPIKIGYTKDSVLKRLAALQLANPYPLQILTSFIASRREEAMLHEKFSAYHLRGEWFSPGESLLQFIKEKTHETIKPL